MQPIYQSYRQIQQFTADAAHELRTPLAATQVTVAPSEQKRIFDRFYRVNSDRSRSTGGSGLGLAIALAIVQAHGGSLQVQSELSKRSTFTIRLPYISKY